ncbi:hypothetical protein ScPMuIL_000506 [Solemya velum]
MGLSEDGDEIVGQRFDDLCLDLNMDKKSKEEAWLSYQRIRENYTLEGDQIHWLACTLYEACRRSIVPTVGRGTVEGNCVSLTRLLRSAKFSLIQFFNKMKKWSDMANLPQEFRNKVDRLERNFAVSTVIFKKFEPIFLDIFRNPQDDIPRQPRGRKQRRLPCSVTDVFNFCWTMFVQVKGHFPAISDDLVNSFHLLLCCIDWFYGNALLGGRKDLLNPEFSDLPEHFLSKDWKPPPEQPCIISLLCQKHEGLELEAKVIKEHWWKPHIRKLFEDKVLKGKVDTLSAILEIGNFEANIKTIGNAYEEYVLSVGDFDERLFLGEDAEEEIGTPAKSREAASGELLERLQMRTSLQQHFDQTQTLGKLTPLTGRRYLKEKDPSITPVSTATQSVSRLQHLLSGLKTGPSDKLLEMFSECTRNPQEDIQKKVKDMGGTFCTHYVQPSSDGHPGAHIDFAKKRLQLAESLFYKVLENILLSERRRLSGNGKSGFQELVEQDLFHRSLYACCVEIVIFSYNSQRIFPWIVEVFDMSPYSFYKVIEIIIRAEEGLSRDVVKHLNYIEESILQSLAWKNESPLWDAMKEQSGSIPTCEEVILPNQIDMSHGGGQAVTGSPIQHPRVRQLTGVPSRHGTIRKPGDLLTSPTGPSVSDRYLSPSPGNARRQLFTPQSPTISSQEGTGNAVDHLVQKSDGNVAIKVGTHLIAFQHAHMDDGREVFIPIQTQVMTTTQSVVQHQSIAPTPSDGMKTATTQTRSNVTHISSPTKSMGKPKRTGSLALFFRKVYHLASVRLRDLCDRLDITNDDLRKKMWTCLENVLIHHIDLMMDRHLDQLIMCAVYVMAKVTDQSQSFQNIMKCYRYQPQAQSHVYRSVLLNGRRRHTSGSSDSSRNGTSGSSSPVNVEKEDSKERDKKKMESLYIRSSSTLPASHPPTPTKLGGNGSTFDFGEERGDLIQFYNQTFVNRVKKYALKFSSHTPLVDHPPLSPFPAVRMHPSSPRRVSNKHSVYISPHKSAAPNPGTPTGSMLYSFQRSPAKNLHAINNMIKMGERKSIVSKRLLEVDADDEEVGSPIKRVCQVSAFSKKLQDLSSQRQEANGSI